MAKNTTDQSFPQSPKRWLRLSDLVTDKTTKKPKPPGRYPIGRSTFYGLPGFPKPTYLSPGLPVWDASEVDAWEAARKEQPATPSRGGNRRKAPNGEALA